MKKTRNKNATPAQIIADLKEEILEHVRALADGRVSTVYPIQECGKQLLALEREAEATGKDSIMKPEKRAVAASDF